MKKLIFTIFFVSLSATLWASPLMNSLNWNIPAPPKINDVRSMYDYLNNLYSRFNTIQVTTQEPNGNISENYGSTLLYLNGTDYYFAIETRSPSGNTWVGIKLGAI